MILSLTVLAYIIWLNSLPCLAHLLCNQRFGLALDLGFSWFDGRPLLGSHKTVRGLLAAMAGGALLAPLLGLPWHVGVLAASLAMAGDLLTSFSKRRLDLDSGDDLLIIDHLLESLLPCLYLASLLDLQRWQLLLVVSSFIAFANWGAKLWHWLLFRPAGKDSPRLIRSAVRWREWRACHPPLARWQAMLNLSSFLADQVVLPSLFRLSGLDKPGRQNCLDLRLEQVEYSFAQLPPPFDGLRLLLLTDLHLDGLPELVPAIADTVADLEVDLCLIGGDFRMKTYGAMAPCLRELRRLVPLLPGQAKPLAVLGNHDCIEMLPELEECGLTMLVNDNLPLQRGNEKIWLLGLDDPHYYMVDNVQQACQGVEPGGFTICLAHSPEAYGQAASQGIALYLCGHTHGGQICLPGGVPVITNSRAPRSTAVGRWSWQAMQGYTSRGTGSSSLPVRFNCPPEITLITLRAHEKK